MHAAMRHRESIRFSRPTLWVDLLFALCAFLVLPGLSEAQQQSVFFQDLQYRQVGPSRGGAVTTVAGHPAHPYTFYMGIRGGGGVWKTENYGQNWFPVTDGFIRTSSTMGAVRVAPSDPRRPHRG